jgi:glutamyl-tRNA synthetase
MSNKLLADLLFPQVTFTSEDMERRYPERGISGYEVITRIGPSPTGFIHLGNLYNAVIAERLAHQSGGSFYLRIEDTDNKREVEGAVDIIISAMKYFGINFDEGAVIEGDKGEYGPYRQRQRKEIYQVFARQLVEAGRAYPCFCSEKELEEIREKQKELKQNIGYYGEWAVSRKLSYEDIRVRIEAGESYVLRFKANSESKDIVTVYDAIRGDLKFPENTMDFVLLKSDGIPTYHFAHVVDDHLMRTTHVIRGEEWLPSLPLHVQLFDTLGFERPVYCHTATLMKMDGNSKRKLSKRKDPELALAYYQEEGYIPEAMWNYLLTILNSDYEEWRVANQDKGHLEFQFTLNKMSSSGALFDMDKMKDISKEVLSRLTAEEVYSSFLEWAKVWNTDYAKVLINNRELTLKALAIGRNSAKVRKDLINWKQACEFMSMYFDETFKREEELPANIPTSDRAEFLGLYLKQIDFTEEKEEWFNKVKDITRQMGYAADMKAYKKHPEDYKGSIVELTNLLRVAITGRINAPDIWEVSNVLGKECVVQRIKNII